MKTRPYYESQAYNPNRRPDWRWQRAFHLVETGGYCTRRRDDPSTHIAVRYQRELRRCRSKGRRTRVIARFRFVHAAWETWAMGDDLLELHSRILARQSSEAIALAMHKLTPVVEAYRQLFFHIEDRIDSVGYIQRVVGLEPGKTPQPGALMQMSAYHHGPLMIEPWLTYFQKQDQPVDLETEEGRLRAGIELFIQTQQLSNDERSRMLLLKSAHFFVGTGSKTAESVSMKQAFTRSAHAILGLVPFRAPETPVFDDGCAQVLTPSTHESQPVVVAA